MDQQKQTVFLSPCSNYDPVKIAAIVDDFAAQSGCLSNLHGTHVLLKPNLISSRGPSLSCSHPDFITGVALWCKEQGAKVSVGDSPAFGTARSVCRSKKIDTPLQELDIKIVNFLTPVERQLSCGRSVSVAGEVLDCDLFIGLPRIKAHNQMYVTMAVKNLFGIVKGVNKAMLHMTCDNSYENFSKIILGLIELLPQQFHLIDGVEIMSESGPLDGSSLALNCIGASSSPVALDTAFFDVLQLNPYKSPLFSMAHAMGLSGSDLATIDFPFSHSSEFHGAGFIAPEVLNPIRFNPFRFMSGLFKRLGEQLGA